MMKIRRLIPIIVVLIGILMTVGAAILSHYIVSKNHKQIVAYQKEIKNIDEQIKGLWERQRDAEERESVSIMLYTIAYDMPKKDKARPIAYSYIEESLKRHRIKPEEGEIDLRLNLLHKKVSTAAKRTLDNINDHYGKKVSIESSLAVLEKKNSTTKEIALFLQIMGLILVLSHEVWRRE